MIVGQKVSRDERKPYAVLYQKLGKLRAVTKISTDRNSARPDVPTMIEAGVKGFEVVDFDDFLTPVGLPTNITAKFSDSFIQVMMSPDVRVRMVCEAQAWRFLTH